MIEKLEAAEVEVVLQRESLRRMFSDNCTSTFSFEIIPDEFAVKSQKQFSDECSSKTLNSGPTNMKPSIWSRSAIYYLIGTYKRLVRDEAYGITSFGTIGIWTEVSLRLQKRGFACTSEQCRTKWILLKKLYKYIRNETQLKKFEFVEHIHEYYKDPRIDQLLQNAKKGTTEKCKTSPQKHKLWGKITPKTGIKTKSIVEDHVLVNRRNLTKVEIKPISSIDEPSDVEEAAQSKNFCFETKETNEVADPKLVNKKAYIDEVKPVVEVGLDVLKTEVRRSDFIREVREIVAAQDKRRDERHKEKMAIFRDYCDRLLAQQREAIMQHKQLMDQLISNL